MVLSVLGKEFARSHEEDAISLSASFMPSSLIR